MSPLLPSFSGRLNRSDFFFYTLALTFVCFVFFGILVSIGPKISDTLFLLLFLPFLIYSISFIVRRLHDTGVSGGWFFITIIPIFNVFFSIFLLFAPGDDGPNEYGEKPSSSKKPPASSPPANTSLEESPASSPSIIYSEESSSLPDFQKPASEFPSPSVSLPKESVPEDPSVKKRLLITILLLAFVAIIFFVFHTPTSEKNNSGGFNGYKWGTSFQEMEEKEQLELWDYDPKNPIYVSLKNKNPDSVEFLSSTSYYFFQDNKLVQVFVFYPEDQRTLFLEEARAIRKQFDAPTSSTSPAGLSLLSYSLPETVILFNDTQASDLAGYSILYADSKFSDLKSLSKLLDSTTLSTKSPKYKNDPCGFQGYIWGTSFKEIKNLQLLEGHQSDDPDLKIYRDSNQTSLQNLPLFTPIALYYFYNDQLVKGSLYYLDEEEYRKEKNRLLSQYQIPLTPDTSQQEAEYIFYTTTITFSKTSSNRYFIGFEFFDYRKNMHIQDSKKKISSPTP